MRHVRNLFQTKHPRLRSYRNEVWDSIENFLNSFNITYVPRNENIHADSLVVSVNSFKIPAQTHLQYQIQVKYRPSVLDNLKHWKIFEDDEKIKSCIQLIVQFSILKIDEDKMDANETSKENDNSDLNSKIANYDII